MLELREVSYSWGGRTIVDRVDIAFEPGSINVLLGPKGAGKTSLLRLLGGELEPTGGLVLVDGRCVGRCVTAGIGPSVTRDAFAMRQIAAFDTTYVLLDQLPGFGEASRCDVPSLFHHLALAGATVVAALHDPGEALYFADRIILMHRGQIVTDGLPEIVLEPALLRRVFSLPCAVAGSVS
jgi:ABC-type cobalamin/Fe3+-siderophores transport system ATPase subunit